MATVQTRATASCALPTPRSSRVNSDRLPRRPGCRCYDLAMDAIQNLSPGVSEDLLLKEEKFKDLRDRLLKSASDFYGKLGLLLKGRSDMASRRVLGEGNFELAELTTKVGRTEAALAAHAAGAEVPPGHGGRARG